MSQNLKIGIAAGKNTDTNQLQKALEKMPNVANTFVHFNLKEIVGAAKNKTDLVILCDSLLRGEDFKYLRELSLLTKVILCLENDVLKVAGGFKLFGSFHISEASFWLPIVFKYHNMEWRYSKPFFGTIL